jgi:hypothetical protein
MPIYGLPGIAGKIRSFNFVRRTQNRRLSIGGSSVHLAVFTGAWIRENVYPTRARKLLQTGDLNESALRMQAYKAHEIVVNKATSGREEVTDWPGVNLRQFHQFHHVDAMLAAREPGHKTALSI